MREIFPKIKTECAICKTPLNGSDLLKRGTKYYCNTHFDTTSPSEKLENKDMKENLEEYKRLFQ